ncbi:MAG: hypothetical protein QMC96_12575 [Methanomicrobiales archaeon]|nr:hypothetical protein [Methanomicrobiales archaeon]
MMRGARYETFGILLMSAASLLLFVALLQDRTDFQRTLLSLYGISGVLGGIFIYTIPRWGAIDLRLANLLPVQGSINLATVYSSLGAQENARFTPSSGKHAAPMQVLSLDGGGEHYAPGAVGKGGDLLVTPLGNPILQELRKNYPFIFVSDESGMLWAIKKTCEDILTVADAVETRREGDIVHVQLHGYRLFNTCTLIQQASPRHCTRFPCPICSLVACLLAEGSGRTTKIEDISLNRKDQSVSLAISMQ